MDTLRLKLTDLHTATIDRLQEELAAFSIESSSTDRDYLLSSVAEILHEHFGPFDLLDENNDVLREATADETAESVSAGAEGWIDVGGQRCYVSE